MCIICVSQKGIPQPDVKTLRNMWDNNPHGAGYMVARGDFVEIHKGFMEWEDFITAVRLERFTSDDVVVYHFRISTQAGVTPEMTHPFPLSSNLNHMEALDIICPCGVAHNGIIQMTSTKDPRYSDTALFIARYLAKLVISDEDMADTVTKEIIAELINSKMVLMNAAGHVETIGYFIERDGILYSNGSYNSYSFYTTRRKPVSNRFSLAK